MTVFVLKKANQNRAAPIDIVRARVTRGVKELRDRAFRNCYKLKYIELSEGLKEIGDEAFYGCSSLEYIFLPSTTQILGRDIFVGCSQLRHVSFNEGLERIPSFRGSCIESVIVPSTVTRLDEYHFAECSELKLVTLKAQIKVIRRRCFWKSGPIESICPSEGLEEIKEEAFQECGIRSFTFPSTVRNVCGYAFDQCTQLNHVSLNEGLEHIAGEAFRLCGIQSIALPSTLQTVGENAFDECFFLKNVTLNEGLKEIPFADGVFVDCSIETLCLPSTLRSLDLGAFAECSQLKQLELNDGLEELENCFSEFAIESISIPSTVKTLDDYAFSSCRQLKDVTLNEGLTAIPRACFEDTPIESIILPSTIQNVGVRAFAKCQRLTQISLNEGLEEIGEEAFSSCSSIESVALPSTVKNIRKAAFCNCENLEKLTQEEGSLSIHEKAFTRCPKLKREGLPSTVLSLSDTAFDELPKEAENKSREDSTDSQNLAGEADDSEVMVTPEHHTMEEHPSERTPNPQSTTEIDHAGNGDEPSSTGENDFGQDPQPTTETDHTAGDEPPSGRENGAGHAKESSEREQEFDQHEDADLRSSEMRKETQANTASEHEDEINNLRERLQTAEDTAARRDEDARKQIATLQESLKRLNERLDATDRDNEIKLRAKLKQSEDQTRMAKDEINSLREETAKQVTALQEKNKTLREELKEVKATLVSQGEAFRELQKKIEDGNATSVAHLEEQMKSLQQQVQTTASNETGDALAERASKRPRLDAHQDASGRVGLGTREEMKSLKDTMMAKISDLFDSVIVERGGSSDRTATL